LNTGELTEDRKEGFRKACRLAGTIKTSPPYPRKTDKNW
jgi:hypothetical protein